MERIPNRMDDGDFEGKRSGRNGRHGSRSSWRRLQRRAKENRVVPFLLLLLVLIVAFVTWRVLRDYDIGSSHVGPSEAQLPPD